MKPRLQAPAWRRLLLGLLLFGLHAAAFAAVSRQDPGSLARDLSHWHQGPVRYLLRGVEADLFRSLETNQERELFILQFWSRRDPDPGTLRNEARSQFWRRVARANHLFTRTTVPGWRTDMGRVYITLGPPHDREFDPVPQGDGGLVIPITDIYGNTSAVRFGGDGPNQVTRGVEYWTYRGLNAPTLPAELLIAFRKLSDGDYELSTNPRDIDRFRDSLSSLVPPVDEIMGIGALEDLVQAQSNALEKKPLAAGGGPPQDSGAALDPSVAGDPSAGLVADPQTVPFVGVADAFNRLALSLDLGRLAAVPSFEELVGELITSRQFFGVIPFQLESHFYGTTLDTALATVTVSLPRSVLNQHGAAPGELQAALRIEGVDRPGYRRILAAPDLFHLAGGDDSPAASVLLQAVVQVPPGRYRFSVGMRSPGDRLVAAGEDLVEAPDFRSPPLSLSTLCLARVLQPATTAGEVNQENAVAPFRVGNYHLVPRLDRSLGPGDHLTLYYQIYGATRAQGQPQLRATYELSLLDASGARPVGSPIIYNDLHQAVQGWSLPVRGWPPGSYRLQVTVEDLLSGDTAQGETTFAVAGPGPTPPASD